MPSSDRTFHSLTEYVEFGKGRDKSEFNSSDKQDDFYTEWNGSASLAEAQELTTGWHEGAARIRRASVTVKPKGRAARRETVLREVGPGGLSMGNYLSGHPQPYVVIQPTANARSGKGKIFKLVVNITASAIVDKKVIERRGAAIVALAQALESAGRRVEITAVLAVKSYGDSKITHRIKVKESFQKLHIPTLAFALAHPSMLRRIGFAAMEAEPADVRRALNVPGGYGTPANVTAPEGALYLPMMYGGEPQWKTVESATEWVTAQAKAQGVTLKL